MTPLTEGPYVDLCKFVDDKGMVLDLMPNLLKVRYPKAQGGGSIYSVYVASHKPEHLNNSAELALTKLRKTL